MPKDEKKALAWFSLAADRNDKQAIFALAMAKFAGRGTTRDLPEDVLGVPAVEGAVFERDQVELGVDGTETHVSNSTAGLDSARRSLPK